MTPRMRLRKRDEGDACLARGVPTSVALKNGAICYCGRRNDNGENVGKEHDTRNR